MPNSTRTPRSNTTLVLAGLVAALAVGLATALLRGPPPPVPASTQGVADFSLLDQEGRHHQLKRYAGSRAVVVFVHGVGCNIARDSLPALRALREQFTVRESDFLMPLRRQPLDITQGFGTQLWQRVTYRIDRLLNWNWRRAAADGNVVFLMLNANPQDDRAALQADANALGIDFPI
ncbi:MAG: redoxin domain-containing protein, partial [Comamonadaceae bacterium]